MKDVLIVFGILLVLLTLISAFGGTIRPETFSETAPSEYLKATEAFETAPVAPLVDLSEQATVVTAPPSSFSPDLSYASVATQEESSPMPMASMPMEAFVTPQGPSFTVEAFDGQCQYASV